MTTHVRRILSVSITAVSVSALLGLFSARAQAAPVAGTNELRLDNSVVGGITFGANGGFVHFAPERGSNTNLFTAGVGFGHFLSDNLELGGGVSYASAGDAKIPGINFFLRGFGMIAPGLAGFGEAVVQYQYDVLDPGNNTNIYTLGANAGFEKFFTDSWALRIQGTYRHLILSGTGVSGADDTADAVGFGWAIAAYF
jgi:hypothetical protein